MLAVVALLAVFCGLRALGEVLPPPQPDVVAAGVVVQYGYRMDVPAGWEHSGGLPERRRTLLTPSAGPEGSDLVAVELTHLGYDTAAEPDRAAAELLAEYDAQRAGGAPLAGWEGRARYAGRDVATYVERIGTSDVRWYVLLERDAQLSVGCRSTASGTAVVQDACAVVVASVGLA